MKDIYDGVVMTNVNGFATVRLPRYFQALNRSFRYQLTSLSGLQEVRRGDRETGVESFLARSRPHEPWHRLGITQARPHFIVQVRLFGQHAWKVAFPCISCRPELLPARSYHLDLVTAKETFVA